MRLWPFNKYPGTDYETFNWEWILKTVKEWVATMQTFKNTITAAWEAMKEAWQDYQGNLNDQWQDYQGNLNDQWQDYQGNLNDQWQEFIDDTYKDQITEILEDHPEWVTTVMDGAITKPKINSTFLPEILNEYATPEMYGAVGDGVADDTAACQAALDSTYKTVVMAKTYKITSPLSIPNNKTVCGGGTINAAGTAFELDAITHITLKDLKINAGLHGIHITSTAGWSNYNVFENLFIQGSNATDSKGIFIETTGNYINEQTYYNCAMWHFKYGIYAKSSSYTVEMSDHYFYSCSTETSKIAGQYIDNGGHFAFINCRHTETISCIWQTRNTVGPLQIIGGNVAANVIANMDLSDDTNGCIIGGLRYSGIYNNSPVRNANIVNGKVVPTKESILTGRKNITADTTITYGQELNLYYNMNIDADYTLTLPTECFGGNGKINEFYVRTSKTDNPSHVTIGTETKNLTAGTHVYRFIYNPLEGGNNWIAEQIS